MSIVGDFTTAFNRQDVGALVACFTAGATYHDTFYGEHRGHAGLRAMFERMFREGRDYTWAMDVVVESGSGQPRSGPSVTSWPTRCRGAPAGRSSSGA